MDSESLAPCSECLHHCDGMGGTIGGAARCSKERSMYPFSSAFCGSSCCHLLRRAGSISAKASALRFHSLGLSHYYDSKLGNALRSRNSFAVPTLGFETAGLSA